MTKQETKPPGMGNRRQNHQGWKTEDKTPRDGKQRTKTPGTENRRHRHQGQKTEATHFKSTFYCRSYYDHTENCISRPVLTLRAPYDLHKGALATLSRWRGAGRATFPSSAAKRVCLGLLAENGPKMCVVTPMGKWLIV